MANTPSEEPRSVGKGRPAAGSAREAQAQRDPIVKRSIAILSSQDDALDEACRTTGLGMSAIIRELVKDYLPSWLTRKQASSSLGESAAPVLPAHEGLSPALREVVLRTSTILGMPPSALVEQIVEQGIAAKVLQASERQKSLQALSNSLGRANHQVSTTTGKGPKE